MSHLFDTYFAQTNLDMKSCVDYLREDSNALEQNHNFFFLVGESNGFKSNDSETNNAEMKLRNELERVEDISSLRQSHPHQGISKKYGTPVIVTLINGDLRTLAHIRHTGESLHDFALRLVLVLSGLPVVIIEGTGGLADVLAYAYHFVHGSMYF